MSNGKLPVLVLEVELTVTVDALQRSGLADIAGLHLADAVPREQVERVVHLRLVVTDMATGLVVSDQSNAFFDCIARDGRKIEVRCRRRQVLRRLPDVVAVPADVPALGEHARHTVVGREIDLGSGRAGRRRVARAAAPRAESAMNLPPDAGVLAGLHPRHVAELVRFVQIQNEVGVQQADRRVGDLQRAPRRNERQPDPRFDTVRPRPQVQLESTIAGLPEAIGRIVDQ